MPHLNGWARRLFPPPEPGRLTAPQQIGEPAPRAARSTGMRHKGQTGERKRQNEDDDLWAWIVIGLIFTTVTLALYLPLIWSGLHAT